MRKLFRILILLALSLYLATFAFASAPLLVDDADLLTFSQEQTLLSHLEQLSRELEMDIVVVTVDSLGGKSARSYAEDYYDYNGYSPNGVLLLVSMGEREWHITTTGTAMESVEDAETEQIGEEVQPYLSSGDYLDAFLTFGDEVVYYAGVDSDFFAYLICIGIGIVIGLIVVLVMKAQLKSVHPQNAAANYVVNDSFRLSDSRDIYLYRTVTKTEKSSSSSGSGGGGGGSHGGSGGKF